MTQRSQKKLMFAAALALALAIAFVAPAAEAGLGLNDRSGLKGKCQPISVLADVPRGDRIGLDVYEMNELLKRRFDSAGLLGSGGLQAAYNLLVQTRILGDAYFVTLKVRRVVGIDGRYAFGIVWEDEVAGFHGGSPYHIMDILSERYDRLIDLYLSANENECRARGI